MSVKFVACDEAPPLQFGSNDRWLNICMITTFRVSLVNCRNVNTDTYLWNRIWVSLAIILSDYRLEDRVTEVRSPAEGMDFSSNLCVETGSEVHPASCTMGTGGPYPGL
jgi:hypothetical protein